MNFLLDTSVVIRLRDGDDDALQLYAALPSPPSLSIIGRIELENGVVRVPGLAAPRRLALDALLGALTVLDFNAACADSYRAIIETIGYSRSRVADRMIAATALANGLGLITANAKDFRDIPGLRLEAW